MFIFFERPRKFYLRSGSHKFLKSKTIYIADIIKYYLTGLIVCCFLYVCFKKWYNSLCPSTTGLSSTVQEQQGDSDRTVEENAQEVSQESEEDSLLGCDTTERNKRTYVAGSNIVADHCICPVRDSRSSKSGRKFFDSFKCCLRPCGENKAIATSKKKLSTTGLVRGSVQASEQNNQLICKPNKQSSTTDLQKCIPVEPTPLMKPLMFQDLVKKSGIIVIINTSDGDISTKELNPVVVIKDADSTSLEGDCDWNKQTSATDINPCLSTTFNKDQVMKTGIQLSTTDSQCTSESLEPIEELEISRSEENLQHQLSQSSIDNPTSSGDLKSGLFDTPKKGGSQEEIPTSEHRSSSGVLSKKYSSTGNSKEDGTQSLGEPRINSSLLNRHSSLDETSQEENSKSLELEKEQKAPSKQSTNNEPKTSASSWHSAPSCHSSLDETSREENFKSLELEEEQNAPSKQSTNNEPKTSASSWHSVPRSDSSLDKTSGEEHFKSFELEEEQNALSKESTNNEPKTSASSWHSVSSQTPPSDHRSNSGVLPKQNSSTGSEKPVFDSFFLDTLNEKSQSLIFLDSHNGGAIQEDINNWDLHKERSEEIIFDDAEEDFLVGSQYESISIEGSKSNLCFFSGIPVREANLTSNNVGPSAKTVHGRSSRKGQSQFAQFFRQCLNRHSFSTCEKARRNTRCGKKGMFYCCHKATSTGDTESGVFDTPRKGSRKQPLRKRQFKEETISASKEDVRQSLCKLRKQSTNNEYQTPASSSHAVSSEIPPSEHRSSSGVLSKKYSLTDNSKEDGTQPLVEPRIDSSLPNRRSSLDQASREEYTDNEPKKSKSSSRSASCDIPLSEDTYNSATLSMKNSPTSSNKEDDTQSLDRPRSNSSLLNSDSSIPEKENCTIF